MVVFSPDSFEQLEGENHRVLFFAMNLEAYFAAPDSFTIDDDFRARLLTSQIADEQKLKLIGEIDPEFVTANLSVAAKIGPILDRSEIDPGKYGSEVIQAVVVNSTSEDVQVSLLNKFQTALSDDEVRHVLKGMPDPYRDVATLGGWPRLKETVENKKLASWLKERNLISSYSELGLGGIRINNFRKES